MPWRAFPAPRPPDCQPVRIDEPLDQLLGQPLDQLLGQPLDEVIDEVIDERVDHLPSGIWVALLRRGLQ